jgi:hypothetical protein
MPWGRFALGLVLVLLLQTTLVRFIDLPAIDLFLAYALLVCFVAPLHDARLGAFLAGLVQDLASDDALGVHAVALGAAAVVMTRLRVVSHVAPFRVRLAVATLAAVVGLLIPALHATWWRGAAVASLWDELRLLLLSAVLASAVAAYLAPSAGLRGRFAPARR